MLEVHVVLRLTAKRGVASGAVDIQEWAVD